ncbi:MAG TPA: amidohydrolase [Lachnospiraceae bacterium]|nr:amidohydrolase [Lachnospiraceae bacterium]
MYITGGRIYTMTGQVYENGTIQIENGKIQAIHEGPIGDMPAGHSRKVLDVQGAWILPGLIEAHCHMGINEEKKGMEGDDCNENVSPITPQLRAIDAINTMDSAFDDAVRAGITSAMIGPGSSNVVGGQFAFIKTKGRCIDDLIVKAPAAMKVSFGENPKVNYSGQNKSPVTRMAIAAMLREELCKAKQYQHKKEKGGDDFTEDFRMEPWLPVLNHEIPIKAHVHRVDDIFTAIRIAKEFGLSMTLDHCSEGHLIAEKIYEEGFPAIVGPGLTSRSKIEVQNMSFKTVGILNQAGVLTAITTDHPVSLIQYLPISAGLSVKAGLSMEEGLKAITINAAKICGVDHRVGSLEEGKDADIAIFDGNPMEVFTHTLYTMIDGNIVYDRNEK